MKALELKYQISLAQKSNDLGVEFKIPPATLRIILIVARAVADALHKSSNKPKWIRFWLIGKYIIQGIQESNVHIDEVNKMTL